MLAEVRSRFSSQEFSKIQFIPKLRHIIFSLMLGFGYKFTNQVKDGQYIFVRSVEPTSAPRELDELRTEALSLRAEIHTVQQRATVVEGEIRSTHLEATRSLRTDLERQ